VNSLLPSFLASPCIVGLSVCYAAETPGWNLRNAAEKLVDQHALRLPAGDWFLQARDGRLIQWEKPEIRYSHLNAGMWNAQIVSRRWRVYQGGKWSEWTISRTKSNVWSMAEISLTAPSSGGADAAFTSGIENFQGFTAPGASFVSQVRQPS